MWLNKTDNSIIKKPKAITVDGVQHPLSIFSMWSEAELNAISIFIIVEDSIPSRRYYTYNEVLDTINTTIARVPIDRLIVDVQALMLKDLSVAFKGYTERPRVDTGLGYFVDGSRNDILNFEDGKLLGVAQIKDADGNFQTVTSADYDIITTAIRANGLSLYSTKWVKETEINSLSTVADCVLYEATPYDYTLTGDDIVDTDLIVGTVVTRYKNQVKEW